MNYEILKNDSRIINGVKVYRIRRLSDGLLGGYIEHEDNLSQDGSCFVHKAAVVYGDVKILAETQVYGGTTVRGNPRS